MAELHHAKNLASDSLAVLGIELEDLVEHVDRSRVLCHFDQALGHVVETWDLHLHLSHRLFFPRDPLLWIQILVFLLHLLCGLVNVASARLEIEGAEALHVLVDSLGILLLLEELVANFALIFNPPNSLRESLLVDCINHFLCHGAHLSLLCNGVLVNFVSLFDTI